MSYDAAARAEEHELLWRSPAPAVAAAPECRCPHELTCAWLGRCAREAYRRGKVEHERKRGGA